MGTKGKIEGEFAPNVAPTLRVTLRSPDGASEPVSGLALVDSGADGTCIRQDVADRLGLARAGTTPLRGSTGKEDRPVYRCAIDFEGLESFDARPVMGVSRELRDIVLLVGRDLMFRWVTTFDGPKRKFGIRIR